MNAHDATLLAALTVSLATLASAQELPLGAWTAADSSGAAVLIEADRVARFNGQDTTFFRAMHHEEFGSVLALETKAVPRALPFTLTDAGLQLDWGDDGGVVHYTAIDNAPAALTIAPMNLPPATKRIDFDRIDAIVDELAKRKAEDQRIRTPGALSAPGGLAEMQRIDTENTAWIRGLIADVGWIDAARFGSTAATNAFFLVQHSGDLELMVTALPAVEVDMQAGLVSSADFTRLHDRLALSLGYKPRYGTQLGSGGRHPQLYVSPIEDRAVVDELRAGMGMEPLDDYVARFGDDVLYYDDVALARARAVITDS